MFSPLKKLFGESQENETPAEGLRPHLEPVASDDHAHERLLHLKIKIKSLVAESKIIRAEAKKTSGMIKWGLNAHRTGIVREYTRDNLLAYGLLRNVPYETMEKKCREKPDFAEIKKLAKRFGGSKEDITAWIAEAKEYLGIKS